MSHKVRVDIVCCVISMLQDSPIPWNLIVMMKIRYTPNVGHFAVSI